MGTVRYTVIDGEVVSESRGGVERDYISDVLGNTIALVDNTGAKTDTFEYFPSGTVSARTGTTATPFQWNGGSGYYRDSSSRSYVRARHLSTSQGRWQSQDPIGFDAGDYNLYRYVGNRFVVATDPSGLEWYGPCPASHLPPSFPDIPGNPLGYGNCCGPFRGVSSVAKGNPGRDCIDKACCRHDACIAAPGGRGFFDPWTRAECDAQLCAEAAPCVLRGCGWNWSCRVAATAIVAWMCTGANNMFTNPRYILPPPLKVRKRPRPV